MTVRHLLVVGATGVCGSAFIQHLERQPEQLTGWKVTALTRQTVDAQGRISASTTAAPTSAKSRVRYLQADLLHDIEPLKNLLDVTHVAFAGFVPGADFTQQFGPNRQIVVNCLQALDRCPLQRFLLIQGMKYYGSHLGPFKTPAKENDPRLDHDNYYYAQQDALEQSGLDWICLRPHVICGTASVGTPQNILTVIGVYASLMKDQGKRLSWPGTEAGFQAINQATDASLLASAMTWFLTHDTIRNDAFNITNGDFFRWENLWPDIAAVFGMDPDPDQVQTQDLQVSMPTQTTRWDALVTKHQLHPYSLNDIAHWPFADYILRTGWDVMASTVKARTAGFELCLDTERMYVEHLKTLQRLRILPSF